MDGICVLFFDMDLRETRYICGIDFWQHEVEELGPFKFFVTKLFSIKSHGPIWEILLQTSEGVKFICENPLDVVIPFIISFEELKGVICEKIDSERARKIPCILYRYPIPVFGGFVQFQTRYVTDEASMQEMFSVYIENRAQISFIELYVEFEQSEADRNILQEDYNSDSEEEFESNYKCVGLDGDEDQGDGTMDPDVTEVANALANDMTFGESSFVRVLDLEAMHVSEFLEYMTAEIPIVADGEFAVGMEFNFREAVIKVIKKYTIRRSVDYRVYESEPLTFYAKCTQYGSEIFEDGAGVRSALPAFTGTGRGLHANQLASRNIQVSCFDRQNEVFEVREMPSGLDFAVDLRGIRCDCGEFQVDRIACRHVFACCANQRLDWQVYVHDVYKMDQIRQVYRAKFRPLVRTKSVLRRVTKGCPRMTRFLNEMDTRMLRHPRRCMLCGAEGHSRSRCRQLAGANADRDAQ
ncbi:hypothetical protein Ahy_B01g051623 [Arachis hypogaea]|uniref:SWIM-type domain-containing protein n=1 Tax=Arachis hypogaea TaxID=3818 RepID=A0A445AMH6_ARAHY|nr:hypothetical protein Ahy_B01g051623 [Arachis hypogaea]